MTIKELCINRLCQNCPFMTCCYALNGIIPLELTNEYNERFTESIIKTARMLEDKYDD